MNPCVTLGLLCLRAIKFSTALVYWTAQFVGGILGGPPCQLPLSRMTLFCFFACSFCCVGVVPDALSWIYCACSRRDDRRGNCV